MRRPGIVLVQVLASLGNEVAATVALRMFGAGTPIFAMFDGGLRATRIMER